MKNLALLSLIVLIIPSFASAEHGEIENELEVELEGIEYSLLEGIDEVAKIIDATVATSSGTRGSSSSVRVTNVVNAKSSGGEGEVEVKVKGSINGQEFEYEKKELLHSQGIRIDIATSSGDGRARARSVVIIGGDLRGNGTTTGLLRALSVTPEDIFDDEDFALLAGKLSVENEALAKVEIDEDDALHIDSALPARLFGFIPVTIRPRIEVTSTSEAKVRFPWWHIFASKAFDTAVLAAEIEAEAKGQEASTTGNRIAQQAHIFEAISNVLRTAHETAMNSIRNLK